MNKHPIPIALHNSFDGKKPLVSICCTTYNHENFIIDAIEGFLLQETTFPVEIIIHDDASTDNTVEIIRQYESQHPSIIKPIYQSENQYSKKIKPSSGFVFPKSEGKYIALCEGDDYWTDPSKLQTQIDFLEQNLDYSICYHASSILKDGKVIDDTSTYQPKETSTAIDLCSQNFIQTASCVFRNGLIPEFPKSYNQCPAGDIFLHLLNAQHGKIKYIDRKMSVYRMHDNGLWSAQSIIEKTEGSAKVWEFLIEHFEGEIRSALITEYFHLVKSITNYYKAENVKLNDKLQYFVAGKDDPRFISEHNGMKSILSAIFTKIIRKFIH